MKSIKIIISITLVFVTLAGCNTKKSNSSYQQNITGKWIIKDIHPNEAIIDSNTVKEFTILNMLSSGGFFKFNKDSTFKTDTYNGKYFITDNGSNLTLEDNKHIEAFNINFKNDSVLILNTDSKRYSITLIKR